MQIIMPKLGLTMTHGTITEWLRAPGDSVKAEEALCTYETEKVTLELSAPEDGVLVEILAPAGASVPAGAAVCEFAARRDRVIEENAAQHGRTVNATPKARMLARERAVDLRSLAGSGPDGRVQATDVESAAAVRQRAARAISTDPGQAALAGGAPVKATPLARRIAGEAGLDLARVHGSGVDGGITREDVEQAIRERDARHAAASVAPESQSVALPAVGAPPSSGSQVIPHSVLRRTIAERMSHSAFTAPHVTLVTEAEATNLVSARSQLNQELPQTEKISYNALLAALVAKALREHPGLNAAWADDGIHLLPDINIALAVDTERGLLTPVLCNVDALNLTAIQAGFAALTARALAGRSRPDDFVGGTFTITNLGALDIDGFTPIINPPQAAILGVGRIVEKPIARDGAVVIRPMVTLSLSFDHRIVDGGPAGRFLQRVKQLVERPMALLLGRMPQQ